MSDDVKHPSHYTAGKVECIDALEAALGPEGFAGFCAGNAIKYLWRHRHKGSPVKDLEKARWYLERLISNVTAAVPAPASEVQYVPTHCVKCGKPAKSLNQENWCFDCFSEASNPPKFVKAYQCGVDGMLCEKCHKATSSLNREKLCLDCFCEALKSQQAACVAAVSEQKITDSSRDRSQTDWGRGVERCPAVWGKSMGCQLAYGHNGDHQCIEGDNLLRWST